MCVSVGIFIAKIEMTTRCRGVGGEEVGVKCCCMQGCCEDARPGVIFWQAMVQVELTSKTNKVRAVSHQS